MRRQPQSNSVGRRRCLPVKVIVRSRRKATIGNRRCAPPGDQEICWQPKAASGRLDRSERAALRAVVCQCGGLADERRAQSARAQHRARPALHAEPLQHSFRVGDQRERQLGLVLGQFSGGGVEDDPPDPTGADLVVADEDRAQVRVADQAPGEASPCFRSRSTPAARQTAARCPGSSVSMTRRRSAMTAAPQPAYRYEPEP